VNGPSENPPPASTAAEDPGAPVDPGPGIGPPAPAPAAPPPPPDPAVVPPPPPGEPVPGLPPVAESGGAGAGDRPELAVGAAFAGGFVLAMILKRLGR
jgi:hypothetical protein